MAAKPLLRATAAIAAGVLAVSQAAGGPDRTAPILALVRSVEAPRGYGDFERRIPLPPPRPLTLMTVGEVLGWQARVQRAGAPSTAAGGYQIIRATLARLVTRHGIDRDALFDAPMQDRLARHLLDECGHPGPAAGHPEYGNCLAGIWAGLPLTAGPQRGRSAYSGLAGNRALTTPAAVLAALSGTFAPPPAAAHASPPQVGDAQVLAFGAIRLRRQDISAAMRGAAASGTLAPSVREWRLDPYAVE